MAIKHDKRNNLLYEQTNLINPIIAFVHFYNIKHPAHIFNSGINYSLKKDHLNRVEKYIFILK